MDTGDMNETRLFEQDVPSEIAEAIISAGGVAMDIETSGLNWKTEKIATCQVFAPNVVLGVVRMGENPPENLKVILKNRNVKKSFTLHLAI
jgi:ribonuclease D